MHNVITLRYEGDEEFKAMLQEVGCPRSLPEIKAYVRGVLAAPRMVPPLDVLHHIFNRQRIVFPTREKAERFVINFLGLWDELASTQMQAGFFRHPRGEYPATAEGLLRRIQDTGTELEAFLQGLDLGGADPEEFPAEGREALEHMGQAAALMDRYREVLQAEVPAERHVAEAMEVFDRLDEVLESCILAMAVSLATARPSAE